MALSDIFTSSASPTVDKQATPLSSIFSSPQDIPTPQKDTNMPQPSPTVKPSTTVKGITSDKSTKPSGSLASIFDSAKTEQKEPSYFYGKTPEGATIGRSDQLDNSGKPFLGFRNLGDTATSTDTTRVATTFDPTKPQKISPETFLTPRAVASRAALKSSLGGTYSDELDHTIALELSGSNDSSNLKVQPGIKGGQAATSDKLENSLAKDVASGKISLMDAQTQLAISKGTKPPWAPGDKKSKITFGDIFPNYKNGGDITGVPTALGKLIEPPNPDTVGNTNSQTARTLAYLPSEIARHLPFVGSSVAMLQDDPNSANVSLSDIMEGGKKTAQGLLHTIASFPLTFYGATSALLHKAGLENAPGTDSEGNFNVDVPYLGNFQNVQGRIAEYYKDNPVPKTAFSTGLDAAKYTGEEFLNGLFTAGLVSSVVNPRVVGVTNAGDVKVPEGTVSGQAPKSFRSYEPAVYNKPIAPEIFDKITKDNSISVKSSYDPKMPTYFEYTGKSPTVASGRFVQVKPSFLETFVKKFGGDITKVPTNALVTVGEVARTMSDYVKSIPNKQGGFIKVGADETPVEDTGIRDKTMERTTLPKDVIEARQPVLDTMKDQIDQTIDGLKSGDTSLGKVMQSDELLPVLESYQKMSNKDWNNMSTEQFHELSETMRKSGADMGAADKFKAADVTKSASRQGVPMETSVTHAETVARSLFDKNEVDFLFPEDKIEGGKPAWGRYTPEKSFKNPVVQVVQSKGLVSDKVLYHESFHAYLDKFTTAADRDALLSSIKNNILTGPSRALYKLEGYKGSDIRAEEYAADAFADWMKGKDVPPAQKTVFRRILDKIKEWIRKATGMQKTFEKIVNKDRSFTRSGSRKLTVEDFNKSRDPEDPDAEAIANLNVVNQKNSIALSDLEEKGQQLEMRREALNNNPASQLSRYVAKSGEMKGKLPEVTGEKGGSTFAQRGDDIMTELGFTDSEQAREGWEKYQSQKEKFQKDMQIFQAAKKDLYEKLRADKEQLSDSTTHPAGRYDADIIEANKGVVPPVVRGGIQAPEMDLTKFKDISTPRLGRDTLERNIEKVAGPYAGELKDFVVEPVRKNEFDRVKYVNEIRIKAGKKMKELGIKVRSKEADMIQRYGEGLMSIEQVAKNTKNHNGVMEAAEYYRKIYDKLIDDWNIERAKFGYSPVPKRSDYFRHFNDINEFTNQFGILRSESQLPTAIAGMTESFKPGKPFSTAELRRVGSMTSYDAIRGMDNYLDTVSKQMYHIDSIQRGRALEKYIRQVAKENTQLRLPNFVQNVQEWTNLVSGKAAKLDRAIESTIGRPVMKFMLGLSRVLGRNIVVGNISVAMTHLVSVPLNVATVAKVPFLRGSFDVLVSPFRSEPVTIVDGIESSFLTRRYPEKYIQPTTFQKVENTLGWLFHITDMFKSKLAVASKYYEAKSRGLSKTESMKQADEYAGRIVGDYSTGNRPNLMNTHTTQLISQFQLGVNDGLSVLTHDIPHWENGNKFKIAYRLAAFFVFSYLFNELYKKMRGSGKGIDPIDAGLTLAGLNDEGSGQDFLSRLKLAGGDIAGELPFTSVVTGGFPLAQAFPLADLISGKLGWAAFSKQLLADFGSPIGGGTQVKKSIEGLEAYQAGQTTTPAGKVSKTIDKTPANLIKGLIFGKSGFSEVSSQNNETTRLMGLINSKTADSAKQAESLNQQFRGMSPAEAAAAWDKLHQDNPALATHVSDIANQEKEGMTLNERLIKQLGVTNGQRANYIYNQLQKLGSDKERADLWDRYVKLKIISTNVADQLTNLIGKNK